mmetsp:Transcript_27022/g.59438  ORF Transcript_27022/g.59438 Transcript_27022/m.59438 type:complete len:251 (-) Transcript_27022:63-815(-)
MRLLQTLRLLRLLGQSCELFHAIGHVFEGEKSRPSNKTVSTSGSTSSNSFLCCLDSPVDFNINIQITIDDPFSDLLDFRNHRWDEFLSSKAWIYRHYQNMIDQIQNMFNHFGRSVRVHCHGGRTAQCTDLGQGSVQMGLRLYMNDDHTRFSVGPLTDLDELVQHSISDFLADHKLGFEHQIRVLSTMFYSIGAKRHVWDEVPIHHIKLNPMAAGILHSFDVGTEVAKIAWKDRGDDLYFAGFTVNHCCSN